MLSNLQFDLPDELIAQQPASPRDHARMLVYDRRTKNITDDYFYNILNYLPSNTTVVANNSKVDHCRMLFSEGRREIFALESVNDNTLRALVRPGKVFKIGKTVELTSNVSAEVMAVDSDGIRTLKFSQSIDHPDLLAAQHVPLPPYIEQNDELAQEYQTIFAKTNGSKAAPTAGLHFTPELKDKIQQQLDWQEITLHVGLGTFSPLSAEQLSSGKLHEEWYEIDESTANIIATAKHVTAVGTTSVRTLESVEACHPKSIMGQNLNIATYEHGRKARHQSLVGSTDILIKPGYQFRRVDSLITNFHLPGTSLLLLVAAFLGSEDELMKIYSHAIKQQYRFYSFGDCMLIL